MSNRNSQIHTQTTQHRCPVLLDPETDRDRPLSAALIPRSAPASRPGKNDRPRLGCRWYLRRRQHSRRPGRTEIGRSWTPRRRAKSGTGTITHTQIGEIRALLRVKGEAKCGVATARHVRRGEHVQRTCMIAELCGRAILACVDVCLWEVERRRRKTAAMIICGCFSSRHLIPNLFIQGGFASAFFTINMCSESITI